MSAAAPADVLDQLGINAALPEIGEYISRQRWSGAADRTPAEVRVTDHTVLSDGDPTLLFCVVEVGYDDGRAIRYALPLGLRAPRDALGERSPDYMIGTTGSGDAARLLYDALGDAVYVHWCWRTMRDATSTATARGTLSGVALRALPADDQPDVRMLAVEQSNTSLVLGGELFFKHLRRIEDGPSQELEMAGALMQAGFEHAVPVLATLQYQAGDAAAPIVMLQPFLHSATEGWALALTSLRDLYAEAEERSAESSRDVHIAVDDQGGAFVPEAGRLGQVTAQLHIALSAPGLGAGFDAKPVDAAALQTWADSMVTNLDSLLSNPSAVLDPVRDVRGALVERYEALRAIRPEGLCIRVHGDLHLGQMLRVVTGWVILDFEGEPNRSPEERRRLSSPLRDVAGMLRSFDYAAAVALSERSRPDSEEWERMMVYGDAWAAANRDAFWSAYLEAASGTDLLPSAGSLMVVRRAFEVDKAVYEVGYELGHRPSWVPIPLRFLLRGVT